MKKTLIFILIIAMAFSICILPAWAVSENAQITIYQNNSNESPKMDGVVNKDEYGAKIHSIDPNNDEFIWEFNSTKDIEADFYAAWDNENLYLAWVQYTDTEFFVGDIDSSGLINAEDLSRMWEYTCIQFIIIDGVPEKDITNYQTAQWNGEYLEIGITVGLDNSPYKAIWSKPNGSNFTTNDYNFAGIRDKTNGTITYEISLPWAKIGLSEFGDGSQFGLSYAITDQNGYSEENKSTNRMVEWQDAIFGIKNADSAAVVTLSGMTKLKDTSPIKINGSYLKNFLEGNTVEYLLSQFDNSNGLTVKSANGETKNKTDKLFSGDKITFNNINYTIIVKGDINGDGKIDPQDYSMCKRYYLDSLTLQDWQIQAAIVSISNNTGKVSTSDYSTIKRHYLGSLTISN